MEMEKLLQTGKEFGLEGEKLLEFVQKQQKLDEEKEEKRQKLEEERRREEEEKEEERRQLEEEKEEKRRQLEEEKEEKRRQLEDCLLYTSPSPRDGLLSRMPSSA